MPDVCHRQKLASCDRFYRVPDSNAVHDNLIAGREIGDRKFVFRWNVGINGVSFAAVLHGLASAQICKRDEHIVMGIDLYDA